MRTSNKIILGIFLTPLLILTMIHLTLFAKYKSGNYIAMKTVTEDRFERLALTHIISVSVYGLNNFTVIPSDTTKLEIEKDHNRLSYVVNGDSLVVRGDTANAAQNKSNRNYQAVNIYLAPGTAIKASNSAVLLRGSKDSLKAWSYSIALNSSSSFSIGEHAGSEPVYINELAIAATGGSNIELTGSSRINTLQLHLQNTEFTDNGASVNHLSIIADKKSVVVLTGDNLARVNLVKQP